MMVCQDLEMKFASRDGLQSKSCFFFLLFDIQLKRKRHFSVIITFDYIVSSEKLNLLHSNIEVKFTS